MIILTLELPLRCLFFKIWHTILAKETSWIAIKSLEHLLLRIGSLVDKVAC